MKWPALFPSQPERSKAACAAAWTNSEPFYAMPTIDEQRDAALTGVLTSPPAPAPADAALRRWVHDAHQTTAALLLASAPAVAVPADSWAGIHSALAVRRQRQAWHR